MNRTKKELCQAQQVNDWSDTHKKRDPLARALLKRSWIGISLLLKPLILLLSTETAQLDFLLIQVYAIK